MANCASYAILGVLLTILSEILLAMLWRTWSARRRSVSARHRKAMRLIKLPYCRVVDTSSSSTSSIKTNTPSIDTISSTIATLAVEIFLSEQTLFSA